MLQRIGLVALLLVCAGPVLAQDDVLTNFSSADFEQFLRDDLKREYDKKPLQNGLFDYDIKGTAYFALLNPGGKFLLFQVRGSGEGVTLEQLNNWNRDAVYSRAYLLGKGLVFEVPIGYAGGTTRGILRSYYTNLEREYEAFKKSLNK